MSQRNSRFFSFLLMLGALVFLTLFLLWPSAQKETSPRITASSPQAQALVNKHLWLTSQAQEMVQKKREYENAYNTLHVGDSIWPQSSQKNDLGVDHSPDRNETNSYEDLNRYRKEIQAGNPDQIIQNQIADQERASQYAEEYQAEYARQFVENARLHGYKVELNSNYVVIGVSRIPASGNRVPGASEFFSGPQAK